MGLFEHFTEPLTSCQMQKIYTTSTSPVRNFEKTNSTFLSISYGFLLIGLGSTTHKELKGAILRITLTALLVMHLQHDLDRPHSEGI